MRYKRLGKSFKRIFKLKSNGIYYAIKDFNIEPLWMIKTGDEFLFIGKDLAKYYQFKNLRLDRFILLTRTEIWRNLRQIK
jgi:hypothetical protein